MIENADFTPPSDPWALFRAWFDLASQKEPSDPNAMTLATIGADDTPSVRIVLMKSFDEKGFVFFTNRSSRKGEQLKLHPKAALCFHWKALARQVRAEGPISEVADAESDAYFATRPRGHQIGAWASQQSQPLASRADMERRALEIEKKYEGQKIPRPPYWGGYRLNPTYLEFWQERLHRMHDRIVYHKASVPGAWEIERLYP